MTLEKPESVRESEFASLKWDEITHGRTFKETDIPSLELLVSWHEIAHKCKQDMTMGGSVQVAYEINGDIKALPQISALKMASAEIRQLNRELGITTDATTPDTKKRKATVLHVIQNNREERRSKAKM